MRMIMGPPWRALGLALAAAGLAGAACGTTPAARAAAETAPAVAPAGARPDLSGTWQRNEELSEDPREKAREAMGERRGGLGRGGGPGGPPGGGMGGGRGGGRRPVGDGPFGGGGRGGGSPPGERPGEGFAGPGLPARLVVVQDGDGVVLEDADGSELRTLVTGGEPFTAGDPWNVGEVTAAWDPAGRLVVQWAAGNGEVAETWELVAEGRRLLVSTAVEGRRGRGFTHQQVWERVEPVAPAQAEPAGDGAPGG
jgi:hypothetical protein